MAKLNTRYYTTLHLILEVWFVCLTRVPRDKLDMNRDLNASLFFFLFWLFLAALDWRIELR